MKDRMRVLIADDDPNTRIALHGAFSNGGHGFQPYCAPCGTTALLQFGIVRPDVIVLGIQNGNSSCWDTLRRIRELSTVPVIALSCLDEPEIRIQSLDLGADYCLNKPIGYPELIARARALVRRDRKVEPAGLQFQPATA